MRPLPRFPLQRRQNQKRFPRSHHIEPPYPYGKAHSTVSTTLPQKDCNPRNVQNAQNPNILNRAYAIYGSFRRDSSPQRNRLRMLQPRRNHTPFLPEYQRSKHPPPPSHQQRQFSTPYRYRQWLPHGDYLHHTDRYTLIYATPFAFYPSANNAQPLPRHRRLPLLCTHRRLHRRTV